MSHENMMLYAYTETDEDDDWYWAIDHADQTYSGEDEITQLLNNLGKEGWEVAAAVPVNADGGETTGFQMFLKRG